jgi:ubiquinone biosynthesis accessory factor UbiJ
MLPTVATAALEAALNRYLALDPDTLARMAELEGRVIGLQWRGTDLALYFLPGPGGVQVLNHYEGEPDTLLSGSPLALAELGLGGDRERALFSGAVEIHGDTASGQRFQQILEAMDIDWEEHLARLIGDVAAHQAARLAREGQQYLRGSADTLRQDLGEYLTEESRLLPARIEVENFLADIDRLRMDTDRLEARVLRLLARVRQDSSAS